jgi:hypothetical protein
MADPFDDCLGIHVQANARRLVSPKPADPTSEKPMHDAIGEIMRDVSTGEIPTWAGRDAVLSLIEALCAGSGSDTPMVTTAKRLAARMGAEFVPFAAAPIPLGCDPVVREKARKALERAKEKLGHVSIDAMEGDNLAVTLCTRFDDADGEQDENGWTEAAVQGCDATLAAIHQVYADAFAALSQSIPIDGEA